MSEKDFDPVDVAGGSLAQLRGRAPLNNCGSLGDEGLVEPCSQPCEHREGNPVSRVMFAVAQDRLQ